MDGDCVSSCAVYGFGRDTELSLPVMMVVSTGATVFSCFK